MTYVCALQSSGVRAGGLTTGHNAHMHILVRTQVSAGLPVLDGSNIARPCGTCLPLIY